MQNDPFKLNVYSVFNSINGEICASGQGSWCTFIRLAGCNIRCKWCDTEYAQSRDSGEEMSLHEVISLVESYKCRNVTITGGEPLMQYTQVEKLIQILHFSMLQK